MSIKPSRTNAFKAEFPFLAEILPNYRTVESITVKRMTPELLEMTPSYYEVNGASTSSFSGDEDIWVVHDKGVLRLPKESFTYDGTDNCHEQWHNVGYPIAESLNCLGEVNFIVRVELDYNNYGSPENGRDITVYKPPKNVSVWEIVGEYLLGEAAKVKMEADF